MHLRLIGFGAFGLTILVLVGSAVPGTAEPRLLKTEVASTPTISEAAVLVELLALPAPQGEDCTTCGNCTNPNQHRIEGDGPDRRRLEPDHECDDEWGAGTCSDRDHDESQICQPLTPEVEFVALNNSARNHLWTLVVTDGRSSGHLASELAEFGSSISFNAARQAIQVRGGCDGSMITMSIPLTTEQATALSH